MDNRIGKWGGTLSIARRRYQRPAQIYHFIVEEALVIVDKARGRWKTFFRVLAETGMRPGELAGLKRDAIGDRALTVSQRRLGAEGADG
jgi:integrase